MARAVVALGVGGEPTTSVPGAVAHASVTPQPSPPTTPPEPPPIVEPPPVTSLPAPATFDVALAVTPASARIELDGEVVGTGTWAATLPLDGRAHRLRASADGFESTELAFTDSPPPATLALTRAAVAARGPRSTGSRDPVTDRGGGAAGASVSGMAPPAVGANGAPILE